MKYICQRKCFHNGRLWAPGEELEAGDADLVPSHFAVVEGEKPSISDVMAEEDAEPSTPEEDFSEPVTETPQTIGGIVEKEIPFVPAESSRKPLKKK